MNRRPFKLLPHDNDGLDPASAPPSAPASAKQNFAQQIQAILGEIEKNTNPVFVGRLHERLNRILAAQQIAEDLASAEALVQEDRRRLAEKVKEDEDIALQFQRAENAAVQKHPVPDGEFVVVARRHRKPQK